MSQTDEELRAKRNECHLRYLHKMKAERPEKYREYLNKQNAQRKARLAAMTLEERDAFKKQRNARMKQRRWEKKKNRPTAYCAVCGGPIPKGTRRYVTCSEECSRIRRIKTTVEAERRRNKRRPKTKRAILNRDIEAALKAMGRHDTD